MKLLWNRLWQPAAVRVGGVHLPVGEHLTPFIRDTLYSGTYESDEACLLRRYLRPGNTVVELGGGLGLLATISSQTVGPGKVFVYEANPDLEPVLRETFSLNNVTPSLEMCALGARAGKMTFFIHHAFWLSSGQENAKVEPERVVDVEVRGFDDEMAALPGQPDFLVCDIEGGEYELFMGSNLAGIQHIICEVHPDFLGKEKMAELTDRLHALKFELLDVTGNDDVWYLRKNV